MHRPPISSPRWHHVAFFLFVHVLLSLRAASFNDTRTLLRHPSPFARNAFLVYGEVRTLRRGLASQLQLIAATEGGVDLYAVLSPTTAHAVREGTAPNATADAAEIAWLRSLPNLRALRLLDSNHHDAFISTDLPGFPWTSYESPFFKSRNVVAAFLKRKLVWQLMEETLRGGAHQYDVIMVSRPDIRVHEDQPLWRSLDLEDFAISGSLRNLPGREFVPGQPDSWAPEEAIAQRPMPNIFVNSFNEGDMKTSDMFAIGDWTAVHYYCHAVDFMRQLCAEEKGGPAQASPIQLDPGILLAMGTLSGAREATRRARVSNASALARGVRFTALRVRMCLGKEDGEFSLDNKLSGCFDY
jgi:hypothetical protein